MGMGSSPNNGSPPQKPRSGNNLSNEGRKLKECPADPAPPSNGGGWEGVDTNQSTSQSAEGWGSAQNDNNNNINNNNNNDTNTTTNDWNNDAANGDNSGDWNGHQANDSPPPADGGNVGPSVPGAWESSPETGAAEWNSGGALDVANSTGGRYDATPDGKDSWGNNDKTIW